MSKHKQVPITQPISTVTPAPTPWLSNGINSSMTNVHRGLSQGSKSTSSIQQVTELQHGVMDMDVTQPFKDSDDVYQGQTWQVSKCCHVRYLVSQFITFHISGHWL